MNIQQLREMRSRINPVKPPFLMVPENNAEHDLNWAMQQVRSIGKPAGDVEKYNERARIIIESATGLDAETGGQLVADYKMARTVFMQPLWENAVRERGQAMEDYRKIEAELYFSY